MASPTPQYTDFSKDVLGRYLCNSLDEALASTSGSWIFVLSPPRERPRV
jgi:hypothetical protein